MKDNFILIEEKDFQKARNAIKSVQGKKIIFSGASDEINRKILEKESIDILLINQKNRKDSLKQRNSGFNHVLANIAKKKNIAIGINFDEIVLSSGKEKSKILGRIKQNINLCKKKKLKMHFISKGDYKKDIYDIKSLGLVLGMPTWMTKGIEFINSKK